MSVTQPALGTKSRGFENIAVVGYHVLSRLWDRLVLRKDTVYCSPATYHPDGDWVMQQARNASMWLDDIGVNPHFLIHDRDRKYPDAFRTFWKSEGVRCIRIPLKSPRANDYASCCTSLAA